MFYNKQVLVEFKFIVMVQYSKTIIILAALLVSSGFYLSAFSLQDAVLSVNKPLAVKNVESTNDGEAYYRLSDDGSRIDKINYKTGAVDETVFDASTARNCPVKKWHGFSISPDETKILLYTNSVSIYRHSFKADYYVFEIKRNNMKPLSVNGSQQAAKFSPDGRMVAFVRDNNVYVSKLDYGTEIPVTTDGKTNTVINGTPDWVYQEEFGTTSSLAWSPDNTVLSFIRWDESAVPLYNIQFYEGACNPREECALYPCTFSYKYPVAGMPVSKVSVISYDVDNRVLKTMDIPMTGDDYIPHIAFSTLADRLMVMKLNRTQNKLELFAVNPRSKVSRLIYTDESKTWINIGDITRMTRYYENFFVIPSEKTGYNHLYEYSYNGSMMRAVTSGNWEVTDYYGYDPALKLHYFQSTQESPLDRTVSKSDTRGSVTRVSVERGTNKAVFNSTYTYFINNFNDASTPDRYIIYNNKGKMVRQLQMNETYAAKYTASDVPRKEFFTVNINGNTCNAYMIKPVNFNPSHKYPVIMSQYSGPGSQQVLNAWKIDWEQYAASKGYIVVCVDGRGTGGRGKEWQDIVYMQLGKYETADQISAAAYVASLGYVNPSAIGIFGWSYGGYETLMAMSRPDSRYAAGVAVAPVTDWRYYDAIYTERFMRTPKENEAGYDAASPINAIDMLKGRLLIMSGTADDNVHMQNTLQYTAGLTAANKICDMMLYTNMNHSINACEVRYPLFMKIMDFFDQHLKVNETR